MRRHLSVRTFVALMAAGALGPSAARPWPFLLAVVDLPADFGLSRLSVRLPRPTGGPTLERRPARQRQCRRLFCRRRG